MIYVFLKKAPYGALIVILLFWQDLSGALRSWGFEPNPYDICIMNETVGGKQCTIYWNLDDIKISHVRPKAVDEVLYQLTTKYVKMSPLTVSQGRVHNYFGMRLGYGTKRKVCITMPENIEGILEAAAYGMDGVSDTPEAHHMFQVREYGGMLTTMRSDLFRTIIERILFAI